MGGRCENEGMRKPKILITNDDGIDAPGIRHLWKALKGLAEVMVIAPSSERSGSGLSLTTQAPIRVEKVKWEGADYVWAVSGTPVDCVKLGLKVILDFVPDLVVSGINRGSNAGRNTLYSGTVGGAIEAVMQDIPGVAFSCYDHKEPDYASPAVYIPLITQYVLEHSLPPGTMLNVNFPTKAATIKGIKLTRQGKELWSENPRRHEEAGENNSYWIGAKVNRYEEHADSDIAWLLKGYITAVPLQISELTNHAHFETHQTKFDKHFT